MPLLPPIELIPEVDYPRRVTKKLRRLQPRPLEMHCRPHCPECTHMLPGLPFRSAKRLHKQHKLDGETTITMRASTLCDPASVPDPVTPPRRPIPLEEERGYENQNEEDRQIREQLPWLYRKMARMAHSRTSSPSSSTDSLPLITPGSSYHTHTTPVSVASSSISTIRRNFGPSSPRDTPIHHCTEHQNEHVPIWADSWEEDDITMTDTPSDLIPWDHHVFDPASINTPTPSSSLSTSRAPRARTKQNRQSTRSYQPYWTLYAGRANTRSAHSRPTLTRPAALEAVQSTLPSWMRLSSTNRPSSWRHSLIGTRSVTDKDSPPTRPITPPMKFSTSSFQLSALNLR